MGMRNMSPANETKHVPILQLEFSTACKLLITTGVMAVLIAAVYLFNIPNPNMILIAGVVVCSALFGYAGGLR